MLVHDFAKLAATREIGNIHRTEIIGIPGKKKIAVVHVDASEHLVNSGDL